MSQPVPPPPLSEPRAETVTGRPAVHRWALHRRLYDWVLSFAHSRHSTTALFLLSFAESSFFPIPPDVLLGPLCLGARRKSLYFATVTTVASVLGAYLGYVIGYGAIDLALMIPGITQEKIHWLAGEFEQRGQWYVFIAALTPIPFKLLTITAGFAQMDLVMFTVACVIGRAMRFYAVAGVFWLVGPRAMPVIDRYFNLLCVVFVVLLVGGFAVLKLLAGH
ncbi:MAG: DedA family protein [Phycisphaeraceae bacterium]|nr:DedA family protein [Phycisphaeraceae bacterium]